MILNMSFRVSCIWVLDFWFELCATCGENFVWWCLYYGEGRRGALFVEFFVVRIGFYGLILVVLIIELEVRFGRGARWYILGGVVGLCGTSRFRGVIWVSKVRRMP